LSQELADLSGLNQDVPPSPGCAQYVPWVHSRIPNYS
jgi:hypothetical protein